MDLVQAEFSFKGEHNDELCIAKGDIITVTQREDGGWWEGTLGDKTGWFPSNYVKEYKSAHPPPMLESIRPPEEIQAYRLVVLKDLLDSERAHVSEIGGLLENFLEPLGTAKILTADEYAQLMCNFVDVVRTHEELLQAIDECNDRVGRLFLAKAPLMKSVHQAYCAAHPRAIVILDRHKDALEAHMQRHGAAQPGLLVLTTGLSKPFRRLDKYSAMLQELERHMDSGHPDRGNTQRGIAVYKDIAATCSETRRQKELELQVLTGPVRGWQGQELSTLGDIVHMGSVAVGVDHRDRYFVLFPQTLLILSVSQRMSAFIYEGKLPLTGIHIARLDDTAELKNAFQISGPLIERIVAVCQGPNEANKWVDLLTFHAGGTLPGSAVSSSTPTTARRPSTSASVSSAAMNIPQPPPHMSSTGLGSSHPARSTTGIGSHSASSPLMLSQHKRSLSFNHHLSYNQYTTATGSSGTGAGIGPLTAGSQQPKSLGYINPSPGPAIGEPKVSKATPKGATGRNVKENWSITNLRPAPPLRPTIGGVSTTAGGSGTPALSSYSTKPQPTYEEDALVLRVIEAYCAAYQNTSRNTIHSALQPWAPCLPIRGGKLKTTSKHHSASNPQLPFMCPTGVGCNNVAPSASSAAPPFPPYVAPRQPPQPPPQSAAPANAKHSSGSLNSSFIWREANPNNFNVYSASVSSLNSAYSRHTPPQPCSAMQPHSPDCWRRSPDPAAHSTANTPRKTSFLHQLKQRTASNYEAFHLTPLLPVRSGRHHRTGQPTIAANAAPCAGGKMWGRPVGQAHQRCDSPAPAECSPMAQHFVRVGGLYDRRVNRSFEAAMPTAEPPKCGPLRRSTPHLTGDDDADDDRTDHDGVRRPLNATGGRRSAGDPARHSATWCCGNFVLKQWRKMHNYD